jgi:hypothetical protein
MPTQPPPFPQNPAHGNGTCEQCGEPCAVCGPRWCPDCYYVDGRPRDLIEPADRVLQSAPVLADAQLTALLAEQGRQIGRLFSGTR